MRQLKYHGYILMLLALLSAGGCANFGMGFGGEGEGSFAEGMQSLQRGKEKRARELLEHVVAAPPRDGLTDEALFRLALLYLRDGEGRGTTRSLALLERLKKEYPRSLWTHQSAPLMSYLASDEKEREQNILLSRENRELRQSIDRLKNLDLEMEKKIKR
ncbi:MAG: tetratricopeptide repeat protein [Desulfuromonadaceae bacterium]|nr:tetratricopeptide repeat protein [Desulfuromonadaceae bacterium]MDD2846892.1 tetratricopeptide repeat protein [Desulfuromonadaceae bacterium]MDD4129130.1 tetratricopeptide repeat protein [Desulfuromonadaceae bacterium]